MIGPRVRAIVSLCLIVLFVLVTVTGIGLVYAPKGRWSTDWTFFGLDKHALAEVHTQLGFLMVVVAIFHLVLNLCMLKSEVKMLFRRSQ